MGEHLCRLTAASCWHVWIEKPATINPMSTVPTALTTWEDFLQLPDAEDASHYELHDGEKN